MVGGEGVKPGIRGRDRGIEAEAEVDKNVEIEV